MTKINKHSLSTRCKRLANHTKLKGKLSIKRMKLAICDEAHTSSSDEDHWPMLPPTSSSSASSLSPIEEEHNTTSVSTVSSTSRSKYLSSFCNSSISSLSSDGNYDRYKELHDKCEDIEKRIEAFGCSSKSVENSRSNESTSGNNVDITIESKVHKSTQCDEMLRDEGYARHSIVVSIFCKFKNFKYLFFNKNLSGGN
jgi:hypothetical protein